MKTGHMVPRENIKYETSFFFSNMAKLSKPNLIKDTSPVHSIWPIPHGPRTIYKGFVWPRMLTSLL